MDRRAFLFAAAGASVAAEARSRPQETYYVGVAINRSNPYMATRQVIDMLPSGEFPDVSGRPVVIKVNLVINRPARTGTTTDPGVAKALIDLCLANGATQVALVESGQISPGNPSAPPPWSDCGYSSMFAGYSAVDLVDLDHDHSALSPVPNGFVYSQIYLARTLFADNPVFISAAKLKTHIWSGVTLSTKNLFGLYLPPAYVVPGYISRGDPHLLSLNQSIVDMLLVRPVDFAVIDGIWGMQGNGPWYGTPANAGVVLAGRNCVALDRVAMDVMGIQFPVSHLDFAAHKGLGPSIAQKPSISVVGDAWLPLNFTPPELVWPYVMWPSPSPAVISLSLGQATTIYTWIPQTCDVRFEIIQHCETEPTSVTVVKTLSDWTSCNRNAVTSHVWDGADDSGAQVQPGLKYLARVTARRNASVTKASQYNYGSYPIEVDS